MPISTRTISRVVSKPAQEYNRQGDADRFFDDEDEDDPIEEAMIADPVLSRPCDPLDQCFGGTTPIEEAVWTLRRMNRMSCRLVAILLDLPKTTVLRICRRAELRAKSELLKKAEKKMSPRRQTRELK